MRTCKLVILLLLIVCLSGRAENIRKTPQQLNYIYNKIMDPEFLVRVNDSLKQLRTQDTLPNGIIYFNGVFSGAFDSQLVMTSDLVSYKDSIPYIGAFLDYTGDIEILRSLGVTLGSTWGLFVSASFPLALLPTLDSLPEVRYIHPAPKVKLLFDIKIPDINEDSVQQDLKIKRKGVEP